ncbi:hypothetical protein BC835DRAFT_1310642 [Cytidiella melzeri]|nr:hypothetical protein BC835DRAFT_1310642 [Cytidiella melzeri]
MPIRQVKDYVITEVSRGARKKLCTTFASSARSKRKTSQKKTTRSPENIEHAAIQDDCVMDEQLEGNASGKKAKLRPEWAIFCMDCEDFTFLSAVFTRTHQRLHTHLLQQYSDKTFRKVTLAEMGHIRSCQEEVGAWADEESNLMEVDEQGDRGFVAEETHAQILVVDSSGIAEHTFHFCTCRNAASQVQQLLEAKLFPASYEKSRLSSHSRFSTTICLNQLHDRYREFLRVSRCWRYLQIRKWFGVGYSNSSLKEGELALFCAACPQPGINMPAGWKTDSRSYDFQMTISLNSGTHYAAGGCIGGQLLQMDSFQPTTLKQLQSLPVLMFRSPMEKDI